MLAADMPELIGDESSYEDDDQEDEEEDYFGPASLRQQSFSEGRG